MDLPRRLLERFGNWPFVCAWLVVIFGLSAIPSELAASAPRWPVDKVAHFGEYAILAALAVAALTRDRNARPLRALAPAVGIAIVLAAAYGASDEFHQKFVRGRDPGLGDWSADVAGGITGAAGAVIVLRSRRAPSR